MHAASDPRCALLSPLSYGFGKDGTAPASKVQRRKLCSDSPPPCFPRLVDEFLAKTNTPRCADFRDAAEKIARLGFKMFLGVSAVATNWASDGTECSLILEDNPLADFVELPEAYSGLVYCNVLCGVIRGALEMVGMHVEAKFVRDALHGDDSFEIRLKLQEHQPEEYPFKDDD